jgi:hypothetical protein
MNKCRAASILAQEAGSPAGIALPAKLEPFTIEKTGENAHVLIHLGIRTTLEGFDSDGKDDGVP